MQITLQTTGPAGPRLVRAAAACWSFRSSLTPASWQEATLFSAAHATQAVLGLTDGGGTWGLGHEASEWAARQLQETLAGASSSYDVDRLAGAVQAASDSAWSQFEAEDVLDTAFSLGLLFINAGDIRFGWVGGPLCLLLRGQQLLYRSIPDLLGEEDYQRGIPHEVIYAQPQSYVYKRSLGTNPQLGHDSRLAWSPPLGPLQPGDLLLVLSLGLWRVVAPSQILTLLAAPAAARRDAGQAVNLLIATAKSQQAVGDVAAIALTIDEVNG